MRIVIAVTLLALWAASPAFAEGPIATADASQAGAPQPSTTAPPLPPGGEGVDGDGQPIVMGPCGPTHAKPNGQPDSAPHGAVEAGVGTHGYRHVAGTVCKPIGPTGSVTVSVGETQGGGWGRR